MWRSEQRGQQVAAHHVDCNRCLYTNGSVYKCCVCLYQGCVCIVTSTQLLTIDRCIDTGWPQPSAGDCMCMCMFMCVFVSQATVQACMQPSNQAPILTGYGNGAASGDKQQHNAQRPTSKLFALMNTADLFSALLPCLCTHQRHVVWQRCLSQHSRGALGQLLLCAVGKHPARLCLVAVVKLCCAEELPRQQQQQRPWLGRVVCCVLVS